MPGPTDSINKFKSMSNGYEPTSLTHGAIIDREGERVKNQDCQNHPSNMARGKGAQHRKSESSKSGSNTSKWPERTERIALDRTVSSFLQLWSQKTLHRKLAQITIYLHITTHLFGCLPRTVSILFHLLSSLHSTLVMMSQKNVSLP